MMLAMTTTNKFSDDPVRHKLGVMRGGHSGLCSSFRMCPSYLLAALLVSGEVRMVEGDAAALVGWPGRVGPLLMRAGAVLVVIAPPWTPT